jgi:hypothetical protein
MKLTIWLVLGLVAIGGAAFFAKQENATTSNQDRSEPPHIPVTAEPAKLQSVPIIIRGLGTVTAFNTVSVKSRVTDLLVQLDPRPYQATLDQAKARTQSRERPQGSGPLLPARQEAICARTTVRDAEGDGRRSRGDGQDGPGADRFRGSQCGIRLHPLPDQRNHWNQAGRSRQSGAGERPGSCGAHTD